MAMDGFWKSIIQREGAVLDPIERLMEVVFGLIMVLTFTGSISAATAGRDDIRTILWAALGCNVAWGIVDGIMFLMSTMLARGQGIRTVKAINMAESDKEANQVIKDSLSPLLAAVVTPEDLDNLRLKVAALPELPSSVPLTFRDIRGALGVFLLVFLSTFPVAIPFIFIHQVPLSIRISNGIALLLLFITGYYLGKQTGYRPWLMGLVVASVGVFLVLLTITLGG